MALWALWPEEDIKSSHYTILNGGQPRQQTRQKSRQKTLLKKTLTQAHHKHHRIHTNPFSFQYLARQILQPIATKHPRFFTHRPQRTQSIHRKTLPLLFTLCRNSSVHYSKTTVFRNLVKRKIGSHSKGSGENHAIPFSVPQISP